MKKFSSRDGKILPEIFLCGESEINFAVDSAKKSQSAWAEKSPTDRKKILLRLADLVEDNREELALLDTLETNRAFQNYYDDSIPKAIEAIRYFAESIDKIYDAAIPARGNESGIITHMPLGVVAAIVPWNDPLVVSAWKFAPALLMGNSLVIKPAEQSSLSILKVAELTKLAGIPDGVFNVTPGLGEVAGKCLALHPDVRGIFFTGSSETGKLIMQYSGQSNMKRVYLECGGKSSYIVTKNCNRIAESARVLAQNMFYNQGQICSAPSRVIIDRSKIDEFMEVLKVEAEKFVPGDPFDSENKVGCVVSREQYDKIQNYVNEAKSEGAEIFQPSTRKFLPDQACGVLPTIVSNVTNDSKISREEVFGPVVVILTVDSTAEAVKIANDSEYGLAGAVWSDNFDEVYSVTKNLQAGLIHVNSYGNDDDSSPFGGVKQSGIGKDKSIYAFEKYSDVKTIWIHHEENL